MGQIINITFSKEFRDSILNLKDIESLKKINNIISNDKKLINFNLSKLHYQMKDWFLNNSIDIDDEHVSYNNEGLSVYVSKEINKDVIQNKLHNFLNENWENFIEVRSKIKMIDGIIEDIEFVEMSQEEYDKEYVYDIGVEDNHNFFANDTLVHNCHHLPSATMNEVARKAKNAYYRIGVSATPWRDGGDDLLIEAVLSKRKTENTINASKLIELEYLVPCTIYFVPMKQVIPGKTYHSIYKKAIVENKERNEAVVKIAHKMYETKNTTTLILIQQVKHGEKLQEMLFELIPEESFTVKVEHPKTGKEQLVRVRNIEFLSGQDDAIRRRAVIQAAKEKKVKILIGSTIADEGLDQGRSLMQVIA